MKVQLYAFLYDHALAMLSPESLKDESKVIAQCSFSQRLPLKDVVPVGVIEVDVELVPADQIMQGMIAMLRNKQDRVRQEAGDKVAEIEFQVQNLLALPAPSQEV